MMQQVWDNSTQLPDVPDLLLQHLETRIRPGGARTPFQRSGVFFLFFPVFLVESAVALLSFPHSFLEVGRGQSLPYRRRNESPDLNPDGPTGNGVYEPGGGLFFTKNNVLKQCGRYYSTRCFCCCCCHDVSR